MHTTHPHTHDEFRKILCVHRERERERETEGDRERERQRSSRGRGMRYNAPISLSRINCQKAAVLILGDAVVNPW